jgi:uncharacterized membrane protein
MTEQILNFFGRFHPLVVHLPIGILLLAFFFEGLSLFKKYRKLGGAVQPSLLIGALAAIISAVTGYLLSLEGGYETDTLNVHQYLGIATAIFAIGLYYLRKNRWVLNRERQKRQPVRFYLFIPLITLLTVTGHFGGSLTHGEEFITEFAFYSDKEKADPVEKIQSILNTNEALFYTDVIQPILESKCYSCHSSAKQKGELRLDGTELIAKGGKHGAIIETGLADSSLLYSRLMLPLEDKHHMPPNEKPQLGSSEIDLIRLWINEGARFDQKIKDIHQPQKADEYIKLLTASLNEKSWIPEEEVPEATAKSMQDLKDAGAVVVPVATDHHYLAVNYTNTRTIDRAKLENLLAVKDQLVSLRFSYCQLTDKDLSMLKNFDKLTWLYLDHTNVTDSTIGTLDLPNLKYLNVVFTFVTDKSLDHIGNFKTLEQLFVYKSGITHEGIKKLLEKNTMLKVDTGGYELPKLPSDTIVHKKKS